jgi:phosphogluconate dehydratase
MHLIAMAAAAGIKLTWDDLADLSHKVPLLTRIYPNGTADVNHFHAAGGMGFMIRELLNAGLLHNDVSTIMGQGLENYLVEPTAGKNGLDWKPAQKTSADTKVLRGASDPFQKTGGLNVLKGNIGTAVIKSSSIPDNCHIIEAPAQVFHSQEELHAAFKSGALNKDHVAVVRFQGPKATGMPELQNRGIKTALVTDGRMSGASGKVPAAIHVAPEAAAGGAIARIKDGDIIRIDADAGTMQVLVDEKEFNARPLATCDLSSKQWGNGRELFSMFRKLAGNADEGASIFEVA